MRHDEMLDRLRTAPVARLATLSPSGRPHIVPVVFATDGERVYTAVDDKPKRSRDLQRLRNLQTHPRAALLVDHYSDDWNDLWWVRVDGTATAWKDGPLFDTGIELLVGKYRQYDEQPPPGPLISLSIERLSGWTAA